MQCRPGRGQHEGDSEFFGSHLNTLDAETLDQIFSMFDGGLGCLKRRIHCYPDDFKFLRLVIVTGNINRTHPAFIWLISIDRRCDSRSDLPLNFHPVAIRAPALLLCYPSLDRRKLEFSDFCRAGGLDAPAGVIRQTGVLLPMAPCGRSSL